jgi:lysozyme
MKLTTKGIAFLKSLESLRLVSYRDQAGVWTIGYGCTGPRVVPSLQITIAQAESMLRDALVPVEAAVNAMLKVPVTQNEYTALCCFVYNVGVPKFEHGGPFGHPCTLIADLNAGDRERAANEFDRWIHYFDHQTGFWLVSEGLVNRRRREKELFLTPTPALQRD